MISIFNSFLNDPMPRMSMNPQETYQGELIE